MRRPILTGWKTRRYCAETQQSRAFVGRAKRRRNPASAFRGDPNNIYVPSAIRWSPDGKRLFARGENAVLVGYCSAGVATTEAAATQTTKPTFVGSSAVAVEPA